MVRLKVLKPKKEYIILRKARKNHICHECKKEIPKGSFYIEDHINYLRRKINTETIKWRITSKICILCWKGEIP